MHRLKPAALRVLAYLSQNRDRIVAQPEIMLFSIASIYVASGPIGSVVKYFRRKAPQEEHSAAEVVADPEDNAEDDKNHQAS